MATRKIVSMPGDGIGNTVLPEAIRVLDAVGFEAEYINADIGWEFWIKEGNALPQRTIDLLAEHMLGLSGKSQQISGVLDIITELSEQTNLLSLNASIEAAGAGESGKRFAVVASEIRKLAERATDSTGEIC